MIIRNNINGIGNDSLTKLLLHFNGTNGSTTFTDSSRYAKTVTRQGSPVIDTAQSVFGGSSGKFNAATSDYLTLANNADWQFGTGPFTIDLRFRVTSVAATQTLISYMNSGLTKYWQIDTNSGNNPRFTGGWVGATSWDVPISGVTISANTWYDLTVVRDGTGTNQTKIYLDGILRGTGTCDANIDSNGDLLVLGKQPYLSARYLTGWIDELRISKGIARLRNNYSLRNRES